MIDPDGAVLPGDADLLGDLELPLAVVDLEDLTVIALSKAAVKNLGVAARDAIGRPAADLVDPEERSDALLALRAMQDGAIAFYRARRPFVRGNDTAGMTTTWVRAYSVGDRRFALVEAGFGSEDERSPLAAFLGHEPYGMAIGATDMDLVVTSVSNDIGELVGVAPEDIVGRPLLGPIVQDNVRELLDPDRWDTGVSSVCLRLSLRDVDGNTRSYDCVITALAGATMRLFMLLRDDRPDPEPDRAAKLERHLTRIAAEVEASGVLERLSSMPDHARLPSLAALSFRQWQVLSRLMQGDRVPTIAADLYLSQSTVRNHLSAIFERYGVHSQAELLALMRDKDAPPS